MQGDAPIDCHNGGLCPLSNDYGARPAAIGLTEAGDLRERRGWEAWGEG